jgi:hypothetical protein
MTGMTLHPIGTHGVIVGSQGTVNPLNVSASIPAKADRLHTFSQAPGNLSDALCIAVSKDGADDLLPDIPEAKELVSLSEMRLAAAIDAHVLSDFIFDAPTRVLGRRTHPRLLWNGDPTSEAKLKASLGQSVDPYYGTNAAQVHHAVIEAVNPPAAGISNRQRTQHYHDARAAMARPGYPTHTVAAMGPLDASDDASDSLLYRVSGWSRGDEADHPVLNSSARLMHMSVEQLPNEEHKALSRLTHEKVAEVHRLHQQKKALFRSQQQQLLPRHCEDAVENGISHSVPSGSPMPSDLRDSQNNGCAEFHMQSQSSHHSSTADLQAMDIAILAAGCETGTAASNDVTARLQCFSEELLIPADGNVANSVAGPEPSPVSDPTDALEAAAATMVQSLGEGSQRRSRDEIPET